MVTRCFRVLALALIALLIACSGSKDPQKLLDIETGTVTLPPGVLELRRPLRLRPNAHDVVITGSEGTVLRAGPEFSGKALLMVQNATRVKIRNLGFDGSRKTLERPTDMPPDSSAFSMYFNFNGVLIDESKEVEISGVDFHDVVNFPILASRVKKITIENVKIEDSGSRNAKGRNNTSGGILIEEGSDDFTIRNCVLARVAGNGVWTHSTFLSPRNYTGLIENNTFQTIGRDAIQVGHANRVKVLNNQGRSIGYPPDIVDVENQAIPVAIDTSGKVDESIYSKNKFEEINGKCIDLDGFHDGEVSGNTCLNRGPAGDYPNGQYPLVLNNTNTDMKSQLITIRDNVFDGSRIGGMFLIGEGHTVVGNKLLNLNRWHCSEGLPDAPCPADAKDPALLRAGIYLGERAERVAPAANITIENNEITGYHMKENCVVLSRYVEPSANVVRNNRCSDVQ